ncbi:hypothetical protein A2U01_0112587, partial [Trifolium medium]|nr:hypothetical protein [Trifolium medium]
AMKSRLERSGQQGIKLVGKVDLDHNLLKHKKSNKVNCRMLLPLW